MRCWIFILLAIFLLCAGSASAAFTPANFTRSLNVPSITGLTGQYQEVCATFLWHRGTAWSTSDFNTFVVHTTSNNSEFNNVDINTRSVSYSACTIKPGEWVRATVYRVDGNADGYFLNTVPDANTIVNPGSFSQSGLYIIFEILTTLAVLASMFVLAVVMAKLFPGRMLKFRHRWD